VSTLEPNGEIGEYRVESVVRSGSGGAVYQAEQSSLRRTVALYVPAPSSPAAAQFVEDARLLAALDHPNLLPVYDVDLAYDRPFATVRSIGGRRLDDLLRDGPLDPRRAVSIGEQVAAALESLEAADVAPANLTKSVLVVDEGRGDAYLSPLEAIVDAGPDTRILDRSTERVSHPSSVALAQLLAAMVTGSESEGRGRGRLSPPLREVIDRALARDDDPPSPSELMRAAREAVGPTAASGRRPGRRALVVALVALLLVAALLAAGALIRGGDGPSANAPVARVAATIPLQATPGSLAVTDETVWVATYEGTVLRVDPRRDEVVGTPIRFMPPRENENVTIRAGEGAIWVLDGSGGTLTRIDPGEARITGRLRIGGFLHGATVADGMVVVSRSPPNAGERQSGELVRVDAKRFRRLGRPIPVGPLALDVEVADGVAWTMNAGDGTITRVDLQTGATGTFRPSAQPIDAALHEGTLWIPDPFHGTVTPLDTRPLVGPGEGVAADHPLSVVAAAGSIWFLADTGLGTGAVRLYRIDPSTNALVGRPVELGPNVGWLAAGRNEVWARSLAKRALLKLVPTTPPPGPQVDHEPPQEGALVSGPLAPGTWRALQFAEPFDFSLDERGWISHGPTREAVELGRFAEPETTLTFYAPRQFYTAGGAVRRFDDVDEFVTALTSNRHLEVIARERVRMGGVPAVRLTVRVRPYRPFPDFCPDPCVPLFPVPGGTVAADSASRERITIASVRGTPLVVVESESLKEEGFTDTARLLQTIRMEVSGG
jgi:streptogramin lyase